MIFLCSLTVYAPIELTRLIVIGELIQNIHPEIAPWQFITELIILWTFYIWAMFFIYRRFKWT